MLRSGGAVRNVLLFLITISAMFRLCFADMDWDSLIIKVSTKEQSKAIHLLKSELYNLQYDAEMKVSDFLRAHSDREPGLKDLLPNYRMNVHYLTDGTIEYGLRLSLKPEILSLLLPETKPVQYVVPMLCPCCGQEWPTDRVPPVRLTLIPKEIEKTAYTGIIIDCRDLDVTPCLLPRVFAEKLVEVFSIDFADPLCYIERGLIAYTKDEIVENPRTGANPLIIKGLGLVANRRTDIRISSADAQHLHGSQNNLNLLRECRVAVIF
jgi:hypothetical protein